jgi:protein-tyrosine phosphatase
MRVLFVCLGNICRSPTAEGVLRHLLEARRLADRVTVDSCGVGSWHVGEPPDPRACEAAAARGVDLSGLRARQLTDGDFRDFDYLLAMDHHNLRVLEARRPADCRAHVGLFLAFAGQPERAVPDPFFGGGKGFEDVIDLIEAASRGLVDEITARLEARP